MKQLTTFGRLAFDPPALVGASELTTTQTA